MKNPITQLNKWLPVLAVALWLNGCANTASSTNNGTAVGGSATPTAPTVTQPTPASQTQLANIEAQREINKTENPTVNQAERNAREKSLHIALVEKMISQDNAFAALAHLDSYDKKWGSDRLSQRLRADSLRKTNQLDEAEKLYQKLTVSSGGESGPIWYGLGRISIEKGDLKAAASRLEKSLQYDALNINSYNDLGLVYLLQGQKEPAYNTIMKANQLSGNDPSILANLALWGLVYEDYTLAKDLADRLNWSESIRNKVLAQANTIKRQLEDKGSKP